MTAGENEHTERKAEGGSKKQPASGPMSSDTWEKELADMKEGFKSVPEVSQGSIGRQTPPPGGFKVPPLPAESKKPASAPPGETAKREASEKGRGAKPAGQAAAKSAASSQAASSKGSVAAPSADKKQKSPVKPVAPAAGTAPRISKVRLAVSVALFVIIALSVAAGYYFRTRRGVEYYVERLRSDNVAVQNHASEALKEFGGAAVPELAVLVKEGEERELVAAAKTLGKIDTSESMAVLRTLASHESPEVRRIVLSVLGERAAPETFANVVGQLDSPDQNTRTWAIQALAGYDPKKSVPVLLKLLDDENWRIQNTAAKTLQAITGQGLGTPKSSYSPELNRQIRDKWHKWWEENGETFKRPEPPEDKGC